MQTYRLEISNLLKLATPVLLAACAQTGMGFVDTVMAGSVSSTDMAAISVATSIWLPAILFGIGLLMALIPVISQLNGSGRLKKIPSEVQQGLYFSLFISAFVISMLTGTEHILEFMEMEPSLSVKIIGYIDAVTYAVPAYLCFQVLRCLTDGLSVTTPAMVISFIGLFLNIPLNWIFVNGHLGVPEYGAIGCGIATAIVYWIMAFLMLIYVLKAKRLKHIALFTQIESPQFSAIMRLFKMGLPVAAALFFEVTLFAIVSLLLAPLGATTVAAHQVAMNFSSLVFMIPLSIGAAVTIRVGQKIGEQDINQAKLVSRCGILVGLFIAMCTAALTLIFKSSIVEIYTTDADVLVLAVNLLMFAACYQCADAIQVIAAGALRGYKDMAAIFNVTFVSYWVLGLSSGYVLAMTDWFVEPMGPAGFWIGFLIGLSSASFMLILRLTWLQRLPAEKQLQIASA